MTAGVQSLNATPGRCDCDMKFAKIRRDLELRTAAWAAEVEIQICTDLSTVSCAP